MARSTATAPCWYVDLGTYAPFELACRTAILRGVNAVFAAKAQTRTDRADTSALPVLIGIAFVALAVRVAWLFTQGPGEITWDGAEYARMAANFVSGAGYIGIRGMTMFVFPPFYPMTIAALLPLVRDGATAGIIVSFVSGTAIVFPMYGIASLCYGRRAGYAAAVVAALLPFLVQLSTVVLADMLFLTLATAGLWLLLRLARDFRYRDAAGCGVALVLAYLTRPEGLLLELFAVAVLVAAAFARSLGFCRGTMLGLALVVPFACIAAPYVAFLSSHAGHLRVEGKSILNLDIGLRMDRGLSYGVAADAIDAQLNEVGPELRQDYYFDPSDRQRPSLTTILAFGLKNSVRHAHEVIRVAVARLCGSPLLFALALLGFAAGPWSRHRVRDQSILFVYGVVVAVALASVFHFWERYFLGFVPLLVVWSGHGINVIADALAARPSLRRLARFPLVLAGVFLAALTFSTRPAFSDDTTSLVERQAGTWLAAHGGDGAHILSISDQSVYYAHGIWSMLPVAPDDATALEYVRRKAPDFIVLDGDYASERPYVTAWMNHGLPDRAAQVVYALGDERHRTLVILKWAAR